MPRLISVLLAMTTLLCASIPNPSPIPEPSTYLMMGAGLGALIYVKSRYSKKK
jgi:hypothetical protein